MPDKRTIEIRVVFKEGDEERTVADVRILPTIVDAKKKELSGVDVPTGIPAATIVNDIKEWLDPFLTAWLWDYVRARALQAELPKPTYTPKYNNPG